MLWIFVIISYRQAPYIGVEAMVALKPVGGYGNYVGDLPGKNCSMAKVPGAKQTGIP